MTALFNYAFNPNAISSAFIRQIEGFVKCLTAG